MEKFSRRFLGLAVVLFVTALSVPLLLGSCASTMDAYNARELKDSEREFAINHRAGDDWALIVEFSHNISGYNWNGEFGVVAVNRYKLKPSQETAFARDYQAWVEERRLADAKRKEDEEGAAKKREEERARRDAGLTEEQIFKRDIREDQIILQTILSEINPANDLGAAMGIAFANIIREKYDDMSGGMRPRKVDRDDLRVLYSIFNTYVSIVASVGQIRSIRMDMSIIVTTTAWKDKMHNLWDYAQQEW